MKPIQKRIKSALIYRLYRRNNKIYKQFKRVSIREFLRYFDIRKTNRLVGFTPEYVGFRPAKAVISTNYFAEFITETKQITKMEPKLREQYIKSAITYRVTFEGSFDSCNSHLKEYFKDDSTSYTAKDIIAKVQPSLNWFVSPDIDDFDVEDMLLSTRINEKSDPGHYSKKIFGNSKLDAFTGGIATSVSLFDLVKQYPMKNYYLWDVLAREKDIKLDGNNEEVGTRSILNTEAPASFLLTFFAQRFMTAIESSGLAKWDIKGKMDFKKTEKYYQLRTKFDFYIEADWSKFDSNVDGPFIQAGCALLLSNMQGNEVKKRIAFYIMSSILTKYVCVPPGIVIELNRAIPSGHPFTTLINNTVNLIYWSLIGREIYGEDYTEYMDLYVNGDDTNVFFMYHENLDKIDNIIKTLNLKSDPLLPKMRSCKEDLYDIHNSHDFLKRRFDLTRIVWNRTKMFDKILYPSKTRNLSQQIDLVFSYLTTAPFDHEFRLLVLKYFHWISHKYGEKLTAQDRNKIDLVRKYSKFKRFKESYSVAQLPYINDSFRRNEQIVYAEHCELKREDNITSILWKDFGVEINSEMLLHLGIPINKMNTQFISYLWKLKVTFNSYFEITDGFFKIRIDRQLYARVKLRRIFTGFKGLSRYVGSYLYEYY